MTLTESKNICYISDRVACTVELNIKKKPSREAIVFLQMFI